MGKLVLRQVRRRMNVKDLFIQIIIIDTYACNRKNNANLTKKVITLVKTEDQNPAVFCNKSNMEQ